MEGSKITDKSYLDRNNINPKKVAALLSTVYSKMIFQHYFVHCDPHPGNILIKYKPTKWYNIFSRNFEIVLRIINLT